MIGRMTAEETLTYLIEIVSSYLEELSQYDIYEKNAFIYGEKTAYVECLEILQKWKDARENGLNYDIEERFPLMYRSGV